MPEKKTGNSQRHNPIVRAIIEITFIVFLFYSNLLMGEFNASSGRGKTLASALYDIFTAGNFTIAICSALIGYIVFEYLRKRS
jgi:ABC-type thiamin/hydroxymethylpyrimidine transport system permease subunit